MLVKGLKNFFILNKRNFTNNAMISKFFCVKTDNLRETIKEEIKYEKENYEPIIEKEMKEFKTSTKFEIVELEDKMKMELRKKEGNYEIVVTFNARPPIEDEEEQKNQEEENPDELIEFTVKVKKIGSIEGLVAECNAHNDNYEFNYIAYTEDVDNFVANQEDEFDDKYYGPDFSTLDEKLQNTFIKFFESLGINDDLISFIEVYSYDKDQRLYQKWLEDINKFI